MSIYIEDKNGKRRKFAGVGSEKDYIDDGIASEKMTWSSEKILDTLCPPFSVSGNPVTCNPVENYPLAVAVTMEPIQAGDGDPSLENVRAITGRDSVQVTRCGKNLLDYAQLTPGAIGYGLTPEKIGDNVIRVSGTATQTGNNLSFVVCDSTQTSLQGKGYTIFAIPISGTENLKSAYGLRTLGESSIAIMADLVEQNSYDMRFQLMITADNTTPTAYEPYQGETSTLTLPETIYGGTVNAVSGAGINESIMFELAVADMNNEEDFPGWKNVSNLTEVVGANFNNILRNEQFIACNITKSALNSATIGYFGINAASQNTVLFLTKDTFGLTQTQWKEQYPDLTLQLCLKRISPEPFQATGNRPMNALAGVNTLYTDGNSLTVSGSTSPISAIESFKADVQASANQAEAVANILLGGA